MKERTDNSYSLKVLQNVVKGFSKMLLCYYKFDINLSGTKTNTKDHCRMIFLMNIYVQILNKILENKMKEHIKIVTTHGAYSHFIRFYF